MKSINVIIGRTREYQMIKIGRKWGQNVIISIFANEVKIAFKTALEVHGEFGILSKFK